MEKFLLTYQNFSGARTKASGNINLFQKLRNILNSENVFVEAVIPDFDIIIVWEEYSRPIFSYAAFMPLISPKLYTYQFQYFGKFEKDKTALMFANQSNRNYCERFSANLNNENVFCFEDFQSTQCNLSWLLDFLMNAEKIKIDKLRNEKLIWQQSSKGYELILESVSIDKKIAERQVFSFQDGFDSVTWQHQVNIK